MHWEKNNLQPNYTRENIKIDSYIKICLEKQKCRQSVPKSLSKEIWRMFSKLKKHNTSWNIWDIERKEEKIGKLVGQSKDTLIL